MHQDIYGTCENPISIDGKDYIDKRFNVVNKNINLFSGINIKSTNSEFSQYRNEFPYRLFVENNDVEKTIQKYNNYLNKKEQELSYYLDTSTILKKYKTHYTTRSFNAKLKSMNYLLKDDNLNNNNWIIINDGLKYGMNYMSDRLVKKTIPTWYKQSYFNANKLQLEYEINLNKMKLTTVMWDKRYFNDLLQIMDFIEVPKKKKSISKIKSNKQLEREKWLRHVVCPNCGEQTNIHKKDKRKRTAGYTVQRFYCNECNSMFQMNLDELEKMIQDYEKKVKINKEENFNEKIIDDKYRQISEEEEVNTSSKEEKESNILKKFFSFFNRS